jgi:hypothetical protein
VSMSDELKERNILTMILIVRFACVTLDVGCPIYGRQAKIREKQKSGGANANIRRQSIQLLLKTCGWHYISRSPVAQSEWPRHRPSGTTVILSPNESDGAKWHARDFRAHTAASSQSDALDLHMKFNKLSDT